MKNLSAMSLSFYLIAGVLSVGCGREKIAQRPPPPPLSVLANHQEPLSKPRQEAPPWLDYIIRFADYTFTLDDKQVKCLAIFGLTVFPSDKFLHVPLLSDEISPESVMVNGLVEDLTLISGWLCFLPKDPGSYTLKVEFSLKPRMQQGIRSISFTTPVSAVNRASFKSERQWLVNSNRLPHRGEMSAVEKTVALLPGEKLELQWEEVPVEMERSPLFTVAPDIFYLFEERDLHISARLATTIYAAPTPSARLVIPSNAKRLHIHGPRVTRFTPKGTETVVDFKGESEGRIDIFVSFSCPIVDGRKPRWLPVPSIKGARIAGGTMAISCPSDSDLVAEDIYQVEEIALYEIPDSLKALATAHPILAFRISGGSPHLSVNLISLKPVTVLEAVADRADFTSFRNLSGEEMVKINLSVRNDKRQFLRVSLPEESQILRCSVSGQEVVLGRQETEGEILIPLERSIETLEGVVSFPVELDYFSKSPPFANKGSAHLELPFIDIPVAQSTWTAYIPEGIKVRRVSGNMTYVKEFEEASEMLEYGRGYVRPTAVAGLEAPVLGDIPLLGMLFRKRLVENYWLDANEAYRRQDYEEAKRNLKIILEKYPESDFAKDALQLKENVDLALRPPEAPTPSATRATAPRAKAARRIQRQMESQQFALQMEQKQLLTEAEEAELKGEVQRSIRLLEKAEEKSGIMLKRGAQVREQESIVKEISGKLESQKEVVRENIRLQQERRKLEQKLREMEEGETVAGSYEEILGYAGVGVPQVEIEEVSKEEKVSEDKRRREVKKEMEENYIWVTTSEKIKERKPAIGKAYRLKYPVRTIRAVEPSVTGAVNVELEQEVEGLRQRVSALEAASGRTPRRDIDDRKRRRAAEIAAMEVSRSIESAKPLVSLGKAEEAARQVETVYSYYKEQLGDDISGWADTARQAEKFVQQAKKMMPGAIDYDRSVSLVLGEADVDGLRLSDEELTEEDRTRFLEIVRSNLGYRTGFVPQPVEITPAPAEARIIEGGVEFGGGTAREALELLEEVAKHGGKTVNVSISSNSLISAAHISAVGGTVTRFDGGYYAVLDRAQMDTLNEMRPPDASEPAPVQWSEFFVGNDLVMSNDERVQLSRTDDKDNIFVVNNKEIKLNPNQFLLVANPKGTSIVGAGQAVGWGEARPEEKIMERGFTVDIPGVGRVHLFEKLLLRSGEKPEVLIEYEEKGGLI